MPTATTTATAQANEVLKHLGGKHNQQAHGGGRGLSRSTPRTDGPDPPSYGNGDAFLDDMSMPLPEIPRGGMTRADTKETIAMREMTERAKKELADSLGEENYFIEPGEKYHETMAAAIAEQDGGNYGIAGGGQLRDSGSPIRHDGEAHIVIGLAASAKSKLVAEPLAKKHGAYLADPDIMKEHVAMAGGFTPNRESGGDGFAGIVHEQSSSMSKAMIMHAGKTGANVVVPRVGGTKQQVQNQIDLLRSAGYKDNKIKVWMVDIPPDVSIRRVVSRNKKSGRFVDPKLPADIGNGVRVAYSQAKRNNKDVTFSKIDNSRGVGEDTRVEGLDLHEYLNEPVTKNASRASSGGRSNSVFRTNGARLHGADGGTKSDRDDAAGGDRDGGSTAGAQDRQEPSVDGLRKLVERTRRVLTH